MASVLIIEDDITFAQLLEQFLHRQGHEVSVASGVKAGKSHLNSKTCDLILLDYRLPDGTGIDILQLLQETEHRIPVIVMTTFNDVKTAVQTIRLGARDYITKPVNPDELLLAIKSALALPDKIPKSHDGYIQGESDTSKRLQQYIELVAPTDFSVIIQGESGTGKELAARKLHDLSKRAAAQFVALDCGALSHELAGSELFGHIKGAFTGAVQNKKGLFEEATGGTIFLDEVGNLSYEVQIKLLRALQERTITPVGSTRQITVDVRIVAATNDNLQDSVKNGKFREDLYHRLNEFSIEMPPLRERGNDLLLFVNSFIKQTNQELNKDVTGLSPDVADLFRNYKWPGNLRELRNIIRRAVLLTIGNTIDMHSLPPEMLIAATPRDIPESGLKASQNEHERDLILRALEQARYNKTKAAHLLNIDRTTLYYKMSKYNI